MAFLKDFFDSHHRYLEINGDFQDISDQCRELGITSWILETKQLNLQFLVSLRLVNCAITNFPVEILNAAPQLKHLDLTRNQITQVPDNLYHENLLRLNLTGNQVRFQTCSMEGLLSCTEIDLSHNRIAGSVVLRLGNAVSSLYLGCNEITDIKVSQMPDCNFPNTTATLGEFLGEKSWSSGTGRLSILDLQRNQLTRLDDSFFRCLQGLSSLHLSSNRIEYISPCIGTLTHLKQIYLNGNCLDSLVPHLLQNEGLHILDVSGNDNLNWLPGDLIFSKSLLQLRCDEKIKRSHPKTKSDGYSTFNNLQLKSYFGKQSSEDDENCSSHHHGKLATTSNATRSSCRKYPESLRNISFDVISRMCRETPESFSVSVSVSDLPILLRKKISDLEYCTFCSTSRYEINGLELYCPIRHVPIRSPASISAASLVVIMDDDEHDNQDEFGYTSNPESWHLRDTDRWYSLKFMICVGCKSSLANDVSLGSVLVAGDTGSSVICFRNLLFQAGHKVQSHSHMKHLDVTLSHMFGLTWDDNNSNALDYLPLLDQ